MTACTEHRRRWLASPEIHDLIVKVWKEVDDWSVGRYVLMPDHLHFIASPRDHEISLERWMKYWKSRFSLLVNDPARRWQKGHWDRRLRSHESYEQKWDYVSNNPVRHELVERAEDCPYQGELTHLDW